MMRKYQKRIFVTSLLLTIFIFSIGLIASYGLDFVRVNELTKTIGDYKLKTEAFLTEKEFIEVFSNGGGCAALDARINELKQEIRDVGVKLSKYGEKSFFKRYDFDYLKRKYFLLELKLYNLLNEHKSSCGEKYVPVIFFYKINDDLSERQGYVLDELARQQHADEVLVLSFDKDYEDEPLLDVFKLKFDVADAPVVIVNDEIRFEGMVYGWQLSKTIKEIINPVDIYGKDYDFNFVLDATGTDKDEFLEGMRGLLEKDISYFALGDAKLVIGRLINDDELICEAIKEYGKFDYDKEGKALAYESIASIGCGRNSSEYYMRAAELWTELGDGWRADIDKRLALDKELELQFGAYPLEEYEPSAGGIYKIEVGDSWFELKKNDLVVSQADRVTRDWLSYQLEQDPFGDELLTLFSERLYWDEDDLLADIGWHEGARIKEMIERAGVRHKAASGTLVAKKDGKWYAPNEKGVFMFEVPIDKVLYPTTRFLREDLALIVDTHGVNMLVEQAMRYGADIVVGCCDAVSKIEAAKYLSDNGIKVVCFTDKYLPLLLFSNATVLGSPPLKTIGSLEVVGRNMIRFTVDDKIIAQDVEDYSNVQSYYDTPARYFRQFEKHVDLDVDYVSVDGPNQMNRVIEKAGEYEGRVVVGVRVYNRDDYEQVAGWLEESERHKAVLFHSASYPWGYRLFYEFEGQVAFDDINPVFV
jgi:hypothetical protein